MKVGLLAAAMLAPLAHGGTLIQGRDDTGGVTEIKIADGSARIETGDDSGYMLVHMAAAKVYSVNTEQQMVLDVSSAPPGPAGDGTAPTPTVTKVGQGPTIAGYATVQYRVAVGTEHCFDDYLAPKALEDEDIRGFLQAMADWSQRLHGAGPADEDECDAVADAMNGRYPHLGVPMRTVDAAGTVVHEITRIKSGTSFPGGIFDLPADFPVLTQEQLMKRMRKQDEQGDLQPPAGHLDEMQEDSQDMLQRLLEQE